MRDDSCCLLVTAVVKNTLPQRPTAQGRLCSETEKLTSHSWAHSFPFISAALTFKSFVAVRLLIRLFLQRFSTFLEKCSWRTQASDVSSSLESATLRRHGTFGPAGIPSHHCQLQHDHCGVYVVHKGAVLAACGLSGPDGGPTRPDPCDRSPGDRRRPPPCREPRHLTVPDFSSSYIVHLFLRMLTEAAFGASHYLLFGFLVPKRFSCTHSPCTGVVDCYVSRPTEKSIMMLFMWAVSALSLLLSVADLICSVRWRTSGGWGPAEDPPGPAAGRRLSGSLGAKPGQMSRDGGWVEEGAPIHLGLWTGGEGADSPSGKSAVSGRMGLPDEDESEVISSASDKLATTCKEPGSRPHGEVSQDPRGEGPTRSEEHPLASRSRLGRRYPCGQLQPPDGLANSRSRKSEWV
ncbi:gap junction delta-4 protein isoform X1 [Callorhinus ursinus]|uniref:Gap junction protein n=1 Tax=Callorhinus ursinus TaxID=34884 RepID=A0A3Q7Q5G0_CALUR|nr:gap junction delta-4 protein isoform X1 [Callorhinus ursinus]